MLLKTDIKMMKLLGLMLGLSTLATSSTASAHPLECSDSSQASKATSTLCSVPLAEFRKNLASQYLTAYLITDAPLSIIQDTHQLWLNRLQQCKTLDCYKQQFDVRLDDLNIFISLNQSLTQHYLKFEQGQIAKQPVHLKIHQLSKDRIKIEGIAYRSPKNRIDTQTIPFLAYTTPEAKTEITDNENDCKYEFHYTKAILSVKTQQKGCERFSGVYRLYD